MPIGHLHTFFCLIILFYKFKGLPKQPFQSVKKSPISYGSNRGAQGSPYNCAIFLFVCVRRTLFARKILLQIQFFQYQIDVPALL